MLSQLNGRGRKSFGDIRGHKISGGLPWFRVVYFVFTIQ
jgi:hypothetical protein